MRKHAWVRPKHDAVCIRDLIFCRSGHLSQGGRILESTLWIPRVIDDGVCAHRNRGGGELK